MSGGGEPDLVLGCSALNAQSQDLFYAAQKGHWHFLTPPVLLGHRHCCAVCGSLGQQPCDPTALHLSISGLEQGSDAPTQLPKAGSCPLSAVHPWWSSTSLRGAEQMGEPEQGWREVAGGGGRWWVPPGARPPPRGHAPSRVCALPTQAGACPQAFTWRLRQNGAVCARTHTHRHAPATSSPVLTLAVLIKAWYRPI